MSNAISTTDIGGGTSTSVAPTAGRVSETRNLVLVADDDKATRTLVARFLENAGYQVVTASDGADVMRMLSAVHPELLLLDCDMPELDGFELCGRLRQDERFGEAPIIFLTGLTAANHVARGFAVGGSDYISKPVSRTVLLARIENQLELARSRAQLRRHAALVASINQDQTERLVEVRAGQQQMLTPPSDFPELDLAVEYKPAHVAGGDFYEIMRTGEDTYVLFLADVAGHDLSVPFTTGALKALALTSFLADRPLCSAAGLMNDGLLRFLPDDRYVTGVVAQVDRVRGTCEVLCAGHPPAIVQHVDGTSEVIDLSGDVLGMFPRARFQTRALELRRGERLFLYSDGMLAAGASARDPLGLQSGIAWLQRRLAETAKLPLGEAVPQLMLQLEADLGGPAEDDVVLIGMQHNGEDGA